MILINLIGFALIAAIVWWFWLYKPASTVVESPEITVRVEDGVYTPAAIQVSAAKSITLNFERLDASPCAETVLFPALDVSAQLPLNKLTTVTLNDLSPGEYDFHCQMQMYTGVLKVMP